MRVPVPVEWDSRHVVALLEFARVINAHLTHHHQLQLAQAAHHPHSSSSSSSSNQCTDSSTSFGPALPPVALALVAANLIIFFKPGGVLLRDVSLSPYCVLDRKQWYRLATAAFVHVDATHLITNLTAALPEVLLLEEVQGSGPLLADLALLTLLSHLLYGEGGGVGVGERGGAPSTGSHSRRGEHQSRAAAPAVCGEGSGSGAGQDQLQQQGVPCTCCSGFQRSPPMTLEPSRQRASDS
jgi:hypothetical protein